MITTFKSTCENIFGKSNQIQIPIITIPKKAKVQSAQSSTCGYFALYNLTKTLDGNFLKFNVKRNLKENDRIVYAWYLSTFN